MLFRRLRTQWRSGMGGAVGLDYQVAFRLMDQAGIAGPAWDDVLDDLQVMEMAALEAMADARDEKGRK